MPDPNWTTRTQFDSGRVSLALRHLTRDDESYCFVPATPTPIWTWVGLTLLLAAVLGAVGAAWYALGGLVATGG